MRRLKQKIKRIATLTCIALSLCSEYSAYSQERPPDSKAKGEVFKKKNDNLSIPQSNYAPQNKKIKKFNELSFRLTITPYNQLEKYKFDLENGNLDNYPRELPKSRLTAIMFLIDAHGELFPNTPYEFYLYNSEGKRKYSLTSPVHPVDSPYLTFTGIGRNWIKPDTYDVVVSVHGNPFLTNKVSIGGNKTK